MLRLVYSNHIEELTAALIEDLARDGRGDPFLTTEIVVPNRHIGAYLKTQIARQRGLAANIGFPYFDTFVVERLKQVRPDLRVLGKQRIAATLLGLLSSNGLLDDPIFDPVRRYLDVADLRSREKRTAQLADAVARLFIDYDQNDPELMTSWERGQSDGAHSAPWQSHLWRTLFASPGLRDGDDRLCLPLLRCFARKGSEKMTVAGPIRMFGFSHLPPGHAMVMAELAQGNDLSLFAFNPCMEYWDDLRTEWERRASRTRWTTRTGAPQDLVDDDDPSALRLWGRPGRDTIRLLNRLSQCDFEPRFVDPSAARKTLLSSIQSDILFRGTLEGAAASAADDSLVIHACPSPRRELEAVANDIWAEMRSNSDLRFNDIAVLIPPSTYDVYQAQLSSVFKQIHDIPHHTLDVPLAGESRVVEAFDLLVDLPFGVFSRPELLRVLTHPVVTARYPDIDPSHWVGLCERLGIVHGADQRDHAGTYITGDHFNWDQGIRRIALGSMMTSERSGDDRTIELGGAHFVPEELSRDATTSAARFALLARSLIADARFVADKKLPLSAWRDWFVLQATTYLCADSGIDQRSLERLVAAIESLAGLDVRGEAIGYTAVRELLRGQTGSLKSSRGAFLAHGVTVAPLTPMRVLPYRIVYVAGMSERSFPRQTGDDPLDARDKRQRIDARELDRYTFLETILAARDKLRVSYVGRDSLTGEALAPASVVTELTHIVEGDYGCRARLVQHPLRAYDERYFDGSLTSFDREAARHARCVAMRNHLRSQLADSGARLGDDTDLEPLVRQPRIEALLKYPLREESVKHDERSSVTVPIAHLRRFLESPLQGWAMSALGLREADIEDAASVVDEPYGLDALASTVLLREVFLAAARSGPPAPRIVDDYRAALNRLQQTGRAPIGVFGEHTRARHEALLLGWAQALSQGIPGFAGITVTGFGGAREHSHVDHVRPPIRLTCDVGRSLTVELVGTTQPTAHSPESTVILTTAKNKAPKYRLRAFLDHILLAATGDAADVQRVVAIALADGNIDRFDLAGVSAVQARSYLESTLAELFAANHDYLLPCEAVFEQRKKPQLTVPELVASVAKSSSDRHGPITRRDRLAPPERAADLIRARFSLYFDLETEAR